MTSLSISENSSYLSKIMEYKLIGEIASSLWKQGKTCDVLRQDVDNSGYDLVIECGKVIRHIQVKTSTETAKAAYQKANLKLELKPSACIIWVRYDELTLAIKYFEFFSNGFSRLQLKGRPIAKHTKGNSSGKKLLRPNIVTVKKSDFSRILTTEKLVQALFG